MIRQSGADAVLFRESVWLGSPHALKITQVNDRPLHRARPCRQEGNDLSSKSHIVLLHFAGGGREEDAVISSSRIFKQIWNLVDLPIVVSFGIMTRWYRVCDVMCSAAQVHQSTSSGGAHFEHSPQRRVFAIRGRDTLALSHAFNHLHSSGLGCQTSWARASTLSINLLLFRVSVRLRNPRPDSICRRFWFQCSPLL